jgi:AAA15 family ATPase/GTPase
MSFKEQATLYLEPTKDKEHQENIISIGENKGLSVIATYGANASGKTNFYKAITMALIMLRGSNTRQINEPLLVVPFKFSPESVKNPSKFEFQFVARDNIKYIYGFTADHQRVYEEYLYKYSSRKATKIFERKNIEEYSFTAREKNVLSPLTQWNTPNKFFLSTATLWNAQITKAPMEWLTEGIDTYTDLGGFNPEMIQAYQSENADAYFHFAEKMMRETDISITGIKAELKKTPINPNFMPLIPGLIINGQLIQPQEQTQLEITTYHEVKSGNKNVQYNLKLEEESLGTQLLISFSPLLKNALDKGKTIVIDEIERNLHPNVVQYIINIFRNAEINKNGAQLIITTHNTAFLSLNTFRRDQIYLVEKDRETEESSLYSLKDYSVRKGENIEKGYLLGRYGAVPNIKGGDIV